MATAFPSRAVGRAYPVHGVLSAYPLALFSAALVTDITYARTAQMMWADFSIWLITGGLAMGGLALVAGLVDALRHRGRARPRGSWGHAIGTLVMLALALVNAFIHSRDAWTSVVPTGLVLSAIVTVLALATSWQGFSLQAREGTR